MAPEQLSRTVTDEWDFRGEPISILERIVADDNDYVEVEAVVRVPKGERLADSKKTEGWSRGFTPKTSDKGPEHVEIRIKDDEAESSDGDGGTEFVYVYDSGHYEKSREEEELENLLRAVVLVAFIKAIEVAQPHLKRALTERVIPFLNTKWELVRQRVAHHKAQREARRTKRATSKALGSGTQTPATVLQVVPVDGAQHVTMTGAEVNRHLAELIVAKHFVNEKERLLANVRIDDGEDMADALRAITPEQLEDAVSLILATKPNLLDDLATGNGPYQLSRRTLARDTVPPIDL